MSEIEDKNYLFRLMNMPRAARRAHAKKYGMKIPGIQDDHHAKPASEHGIGQKKNVQTISKYTGETGKEGDATGV
jgi:hypothetical protein